MRHLSSVHLHLQVAIGYNVINFIRFIAFMNYSDLDIAIDLYELAFELVA